MIYQRTIESMTEEPTEPRTFDLNASDIEQWMRNNCPLLFESILYEHQEARIEAILPSLVESSTEPAAARDSIAAEREKARIEFFEQRSAQFDQLVDLAFQDSLEGQNARLALIYIAVNLGIPLPPEDREAAVSLVTGTLGELCKPGHVDRSEIAPPLSLLLGKTIGLNQESRRDLLSGLRALYLPDSEGARAITLSEYSMILMDALELELGRFPSNQDYQYQIELVSDLKTIGHPRILPVLDAMRQAHSSSDIQRAAREAMADIEEPILPIWDDTIADQIATHITRAERLAAALENETDERQKVRAIFEAAKGCPIENQADPRLPLITALLTNGSTRLRLAAAKCLSMSHPDHCSEWASCIAELSRIAVNSSSINHSKESLQILKALRDRGAEIAREIDKATINANLEFLKQHLPDSVSLDSQNQEQS